MNAIVSAKYILYIVLFVVFVSVRIIYNFSTNSIFETDFQGLALSSASFPFGIIKETVKNSFFMPFYYIFIHFFTVIFKKIIVLRIINSIIALFNVFLFFKIGKKLKNEALGLFLALFLTINHFFLFYTNLIAPYCLNFLTVTLLIYFLISYLKKPNQKNFKNLTILNCLFIIFDNFGFIFVGCELLILYLISEKKTYIKKTVLKLLIQSFYAFLTVAPILIIQYYSSLKQLIPETYSGVGLNFNSFYLLINEYISPYLSFCVPDFQTKSTLGMLYSFFINPDFKSLNTIKIAISLFYGSILPIAVLIFFTFKAVIKNTALKILLYILLFNILIVSIFMLYETIDVNPIYLYPLFISSLIFLGYGIFQIKDIFIRSIIIFCLFLIQIINPNINSFNIIIKKNYPTVNVFNIFSQDYQLNDKDLIIMPYLGNYAKLYYKNLNFVDFDYTSLKKISKNGIVKGIITKNAPTINKYNISYLTKDYLKHITPDTFITTFFISECLNKSDDNNRIILFVDKLNSKPISNKMILRQYKNSDYRVSLRKIVFRNAYFLQNDTEILYDSLKARTLYNFIYLLEESYYLNNIIEYKKIDNEYYKTASKTAVSKALANNESDYLFFIFTKKTF